MAEPLAAVAVAQSAAPTYDEHDPGARGTLIIADKVAQRIAAKAACDTAGVQPRAAALDKLTGRRLPKVTVMISADRVHASVDVAVSWPYPLTQVSAAVRDNVASALSQLAGLHVDGVDVTVSNVITNTYSTPARILQ